MKINSIAIVMQLEDLEFVRYSMYEYARKFGYKIHPLFLFEKNNKTFFSFYLENEDLYQYLTSLKNGYENSAKFVEPILKNLDPLCINRKAIKRYYEFPEDLQEDMVNEHWIPGDLKFVGNPEVEE